MAFETIAADIGILLAAADLSASQFCCVQIDSAGKIALPTVAGQKVAGILQDKPASGKVGTFRHRDVSMASYGGTVTKGDKLTTGTDGRLNTSLAVSDYQVGWALESGVAGDVGSILMAKGPGGVGGGAPLILSFQIDLASVTGSQDIVTAYTPGFAGRIVKMSYVANVPATTASKLATLTPFIGATAVTGGVIALTTALAAPMGKVTDGSAVTALNVFAATDTISIKSTAVTAFVEGSGTLVLVLN